jgi:hypothetical protein
MDATLPLRSLKDAIDIRRTVLMERAEARRRGSRNLTLACGVIALLSGTGMTAMLFPDIANIWGKLLSAILAFISGKGLYRCFW